MHRREFLEGMLGAAAVGTLEAPSTARSPVSRPRGEIRAAAVAAHQVDRGNPQRIEETGEHRRLRAGIHRLPVGDLGEAQAE